MNSQLNTEINIIERRLAHAREREHRAHLQKLDWVVEHAKCLRERLTLEDQLAALELRKKQESHL